MRTIVREEVQQAADLHRLRAQLERMQGRRLEAPLLPTPPVLADLLPGGGLRAGAAYALPSSSGLLLSLLARPTRAGSWCAAVGMPDLGAEAAAGYGVVLDRLVLVPEPGPRWVAVAATLAEVMTIVAVRPGARATDAEASRLQARLRDRGAALLVQGGWPQAEAVLEISDPHWSGLGQGHGYLAEREVTVSVRSRRAAAPRRARMLLPDPAGSLTGIGAPVAAPVPLRAVG
ncbi:MAG: hypothetical protein QM626_12555 [Microbacterium sp.]|uniref:hypothetical protein n=1 Tax=Microbacterium sp. TaxID=51671 RepID=UPI0039E327B2